MQTRIYLQITLAYFSGSHLIIIIFSFVWKLWNINKRGSKSYQKSSNNPLLPICLFGVSELEYFRNEMQTEKSPAYFFMWPLNADENQSYFLILTGAGALWNSWKTILKVGFSHITSHEWFLRRITFRLQVLKSTKKLPKHECLK